MLTFRTIGILDFFFWHIQKSHKNVHCRCGYDSTSHTVYNQGIVVRFFEGTVDLYVLDIVPAPLPQPTALYYMGSVVCLPRG